MTKNNKRKWKLYYAGKLADLDELKLLQDTFLKMSYSQKFIETWKLTESLIELQGRNPNELRLDRTTLIVKRI
jgi:hypothetical protein